MDVVRTVGCCRLGSDDGPSFVGNNPPTAVKSRGVGFRMLVAGVRGFYPIENWWVQHIPWSACARPDVFISPIVVDRVRDDTYTQLFPGVGSFVKLKHITSQIEVTNRERTATASGIACGVSKGFSLVGCAFDGVRSCWFRRLCDDRSMEW